MLSQLIISASLLTAAPPNGASSVDCGENPALSMPDLSSQDFADFLLAEYRALSAERRLVCGGQFVAQSFSHLDIRYQSSGEKILVSAAVNLIREHQEHATDFGVEFSELMDAVQRLGRFHKNFEEALATATTEAKDPLRAAHLLRDAFYLERPTIQSRYGNLLVTPAVAYYRRAIESPRRAISLQVLKQASKLLYDYQMVSRRRLAYSKDLDAFNSLLKEARRPLRRSIAWGVVFGIVTSVTLGLRLRATVLGANDYSSNRTQFRLHSTWLAGLAVIPIAVSSLERARFDGKMKRGPKNRIAMKAIGGVLLGLGLGLWIATRYAQDACDQRAHCLVAVSDGGFYGSLPLSFAGSALISYAWVM